MAQSGQHSMRGVLIKIGVLAAGLTALTFVGYRLLNYRPLAGRLPPAATRLEPREEWGGVARGLAVSPAPGLGAMGYVIENATTPPLTETTNLLLVGLDTRADSYSGGRADALVVLVLDNRSQHVGLVSIPRDLLVAIPGAEVNRINAVYAVGSREGGAARGVALLKQVVHDTLGLPITNVAIVDHSGFESLIDGLEGVAVAVSCPIRDRFIDRRGANGRLELKLEAGVHFLDGRTALMYARSRHGRGIFDRAVRQQAVLLGVRDRLLELGPARLAQMLPALQQAVYTDLSALQLIRLVRRAQGIKRSHIHGLVLGGKQAEVTVLPDGRWVMVPKRDEMRAALSKLFDAPPPGQRAYATCPDMDAALVGR
jgi:polyisoprenyl-teichoic acid--peptidoglycan teichoic acid transferase